MARDPKFYRGRALGAGVVSLGALLVVYYGGLVGAVGKQMFLEAASRILAAMMIFGGVGSTHDLISAERREGTLDLLFLTPLRPFEILLGKYLAANLASMIGLVGGFPMLALVMGQAGVGMLQMFHIAMGLAAGLMVASSLGLLASSWCSQRRSAMGFANLFACVLWVGVPAGVQILRTEYPGNPWAAWLSLLDLGSLTSPTALLMPGGISTYWYTMAASLGLGGLAFFLAWRRLLGLRTSRPPAVGGRDLKQWWARRVFGNPADRLRHRLRLLAVNPIAWLCTRDRMRRFYPVALLAGLVGLLCWLVVNEPGALTAFGFHMVMTFLFTFVCRTLFAGECARRFSEDRDHGALELLLTTPLPIRTILRGHSQGCRSQSASVIALACAALSWLSLLACFGGGFIPMEQPGPSIPIAIFGVFAWFLLGLVSQPLIGAWAALTAPRTRAAGGLSFLGGVLLPLLLFLLTYMVLALLVTYDYLQVPQGFPIELFMAVLFATYTIGSDLLWILVLSRLIPRKAVEWASRRQGSGGGWAWLDFLLKKLPKGKR